MLPNHLACDQLARALSTNAEQILHLNESKRNMSLIALDMLIKYSVNPAWYESCYLISIKHSVTCKSLLSAVLIKAHYSDNAS